jgi:glycosyl transferase family 9 (putative heptosyltransferase)
MELRVIVRPGGLGDSLLLAPALAALRESGDSKVVLAGYPERLEPLRSAGLAQAVLSLDTWLAAPDVALGTPGRREDSRISVDSFFPQPTVELPSSISVVHHPPFPPEGEPVHVAEHIARSIGVELKTDRGSPLKNSVTRSEETSPDQIWIHPGAGGPEKRWSLENFLDLAESLRRSTRMRISFVLGEAERDMAVAADEKGIGVYTCETPTELLSLFRESDVYVGNDSGPTHLAGLTGIQTLAIFGPTDPVQWSPWGERVQVVGPSAGRDWPTLEQVLASAEEWLR